MANLVYTQQETAIVWTDDATGGDYTLDVGGLAAGTARVGDQGDLGVAPRADRYYYQLVIDGFDTAPVVGEHISVYLAFSGDGTDIDGDVGNTDAACATAALPNLLPLDVATVQTTTAANELMISGEVTILARYVSPVVYNETADALLSTADAHTFTLYPMPPEVQ